MSGWKILNSKIGSNIVTLRETNAICSQYQSFVIDAKTNLSTLDFDESETTLREHFASFDLKGREELHKLVKYVRLLNHGSAAVESGFSTNKNIIDDNLQLDTLIAFWQVYDFVHLYGGPAYVPVTKSLLNNVRASRMRYMNDMKNEKEANAAASQKRAHEIDRMTSLMKNKKELEATIIHLNQEADVMFKKAETKCDFKLLTEGNVSRKAAKAKQAELSEIESEVGAKKSKSAVWLC